MFCLSRDVSAVHRQMQIMGQKQLLPLRRGSPKQGWWSWVREAVSNEGASQVVRKSQWWCTSSMRMLVPPTHADLSDLAVLGLGLNLMILRVNLNNPLILWFKDINFFNCSSNVFIFFKSSSHLIHIISLSQFSYLLEEGHNLSDWKHLKTNKKPKNQDLSLGKKKTPTNKPLNFSFFSAEISALPQIYHSEKSGKVKKKRPFQNQGFTGHPES